MNIRVDLPRPIRQITGIGHWLVPPPLPHPANVRRDYDAVLYDCPDCNQVHFVTVDDCPSPEQALREQRLAGVDLAMV